MTLMLDGVVYTLNDLTVDNIHEFKKVTEFWYNFFDQRPSHFELVNHSPELFNMLAKDESHLVRSYVVTNPHAPVSALNLIVDKTIRSVDEWMKNVDIERLIKHPAVTTSMIEKLLTKEYTHVVIARAFTDKSPVPSNFFNILSVSKTPLVHVHLARNVHSPSEVLLKYGKKSIEGLAALTEKGDIWVTNSYDSVAFHVAVAGNLSTSQEILTQYENVLRTNGLPVLVIRELASNPNTPISFLSQVPSLRDRYAKQNLLRNPSTPSDTLVTVWKEAVSKRDYKIILFAAKYKEVPKIIQQKAKVFYTSQIWKAPRHLSHENVTVVKEDYLATLVPHFPEATVDLPLEWLKELANVLQLRHFRITNEELANSL